MENNKKWYTSDFHYDHHNLYKRGTRPFSGAKECQDAILQNFNEVIRKGDTLYILGDLSLSANYDELAAWLNSISGTKIVILGNHDHETTLKHLKDDGIIANYHPWKGTRDHGIPVFMTHFVPLEAHSGPEARLYLHGHVHGMLRDILNCPLLCDVGVDANDFKPFSLDNVDLDLINGIRLAEQECPYKQDAMMCKVCQRFVTLKAQRYKEGIDNDR